MNPIAEISAYASFAVSLITILALVYRLGSYASIIERLQKDVNTNRDIIERHKDNTSIHINGEWKGSVDAKLDSAMRGIARIEGLLSSNS